MKLDEALEVVVNALQERQGRERVCDALAGALGDEAWDTFYERLRLEHVMRLPYRKLRQLAQKGDPRAKQALKGFLEQFPHLEQAEPWSDPVSPLFQREIDAVPIKLEKSA